MRNVLVLAAVAEALTGLAMLAAPSLVGQLLLGEPLTGAALPVARVAGIALVSLAVACWPGPAMLGMATYSAAVMLYLAYLEIVLDSPGLLLLPAFLAHLVLTVLLARSLLPGNRHAG